jgi:cellulose synthase/poly-beta-1,6-N-acetylglucosamine synthase-like glycosyltransferase
MYGDWTVLESCHYVEREGILVTQNEANPMVTIVIPTKNSEKDIDRCLRSIYNNEYPNYEVIIVDGGSQDRTVEIAKEYGSSVLYEKVGTRAAAINVGAMEARGDYIAFTDADAVVDKCWLFNLLEAMKDPTIGAATGRQVVPENAPYFSKCLFKGWQTFLGGGTVHAMSNDRIKLVDHPVGVNSIVAKNVFKQLGMISEDLVTAEDVELGYRIRTRGYKILYVPDAVVFHYRIATPWKHFKHMFEYGRGRAQLFRKNPRTIGVINLAPACVVIFLPTCLLIGWHYGVSLILPMAYFLLVLFLGLLRGQGFKEKLGICYAVILSHFGYGIGFVRGLLSS